MRGAARWLVAALALLPGRAVPRELWSEGDHSVALVTALKSSALVTRAPYDPTLFPDPTSAEGLWQLRLDLEGRLPASLRAGAAWQTGLGVTSAGAGLAGLSGILPGRAPVAYRIWQLSWPIAEELPYLSWTQEVDRLWVSAEAGPLRVTAGRQAVGWGRGVLFGAVDIFAPFPALQADREWRAGVDAVRVDVKLGQHLAVDAVGAFGPTLDGSAFGARVRGYLGDVDGEVVVGWRARDPFAGLTASAAVGDVEVHAELAVFRTPDPWPGGIGSDQRIAPMAVAGASYRIPAGKGIYLLAEYYHSGFGFESARAVIPSLADPGVRERLLRGDTQTLGRDTAALILSYEATEELTATLTVLESLQDGSGIAAPGATVRLGNRVAVSAALYPSWGARPAGGSLGSFWGAAPMAGYVQVAVYD